jgi:hypothetical protein
MAKEYSHKELLAFGYAPGKYISTCSKCRKLMEDVDKYATRCKPCAISVLEEALKEEQKYTIKETYEIYRKDGQFYYRWLKLENPNGPYDSLRAVVAALRDDLESQFGKA